MRLQYLGLLAPFYTIFFINYFKPNCFKICSLFSKFTFLSVQMMTLPDILIRLFTEIRGKKALYMQYAMCVNALIQVSSFAYHPYSLSADGEFEQPLLHYQS